MSGRKTNISLRDGINLEGELRLRPHDVLRQFQECQVHSLRELEVFRRLEASNVEEDKAAVQRIREAARELGIPLRFKRNRAVPA